MSATNIYENINELIKDYYDQPVDDYLNQTITVNEVELVCDVYRVADESELTSEIFTGCTANDANTQIIIGLNLTVADGVTLIPPYRCKGIIIGCPGNFTNDGTISMTKRGASGAGKDIALVNNYSISAIGGSGGASRSGTGSGNSGNSSSSGVLSCGGGGSGAVYDTFSESIASFAGGNATSFSGGTGSGGCYAGTANATAASNTGGAGGSFGVRAYAALGRFAILGGTGNPKGTSSYAETSQMDSINGYGTGGLIVIFANNLVNDGIIESKGSQAEGFPKSSVSDISAVNVITGGSSGGGCIVLFANSITNNGTVNSQGGSVPTVDSSVRTKYLGGAGGNGTAESIEITDLVLTYPLPLKLGITTKEKLDVLEPEDGRLIGLMNDDELQYEYRGKRHRAMNTEAEIDFSRLPSRGQRTPDAFELNINNPQDGQGMVYDSTQQKWVNGAGGTPVGTIIQFFGYIAPNGYLSCDGTEYLKADYPALATLLADLDTHYSTTQYVGSDSDHFKVPDLRGEFLRGTGTNSHTNQGNGSNVGVHQDGTATGMPYYGNENKVNLIFPNRFSSYTRAFENGDKVISTTVNTSEITLGTVTNSNAYYVTSRPTNTSVLMCIKAI